MSHDEEGEGPDGAVAASEEAEESEFAMGRVGKHTLIYGLGIVLTKAVSFVMLPIYTRFLTPADYGVMELIEMTLDVISIVAGGQLAIGIFRYYYKAETDDERQSVVSTSVGLLALTYTFIGAMIYLAADWLSQIVFSTPEHGELIRLAAANLAFTGISITPLTFVRLRELSTVFVGVQLAKMLLQVTLNLYFLMELDLGVRGIFLSNLIANALVGVCLSVYVIREVGVRVSRSVTIDLFKYGVPLAFTQVATFIATFGDRYFLQNAGDSTVVGLYTLAYQFGFLLAAVGYMPFEMIWEPVRFDIARREDRDAVYSRGFLYLNLMLVTMAVGLALFIKDILHLMTTPAFYPAASFVPLILVAYVLQGWTGFQDVGIHIKERTILITLANWIAAGIAVVGYAIFIPKYLAMGAAGVTVVAFFARYLGVYMASQQLWRVEYDWKPVLQLILLALITVGIGFMIPADQWWVSIPLKAALVLVYLGVLIAARIVPRDDLEKAWATVLAFRAQRSAAS